MGSVATERKKRQRARKDQREREARAAERLAPKPLDVAVERSSRPIVVESSAPRPRRFVVPTVSREVGFDREAAEEYRRTRERPTLRVSLGDALRDAGADPETLAEIESVIGARR